MKKSSAAKSHNTSIAFPLIAISLDLFPALIVIIAGLLGFYW